MTDTLYNPEWLYSGRVGHDTSEGFCSCGGYHRVGDGVKVGTKTVSIMTTDGKSKRIEWTETETRETLID